MRSGVVAAALVVAAAGSWYFLLRTPEITNYPSSGTDIIAIGDSLVAGVGSTAGHDFVSLVSGAVGEKVVNLGRAGDTSTDVLKRISELDAYTPKVVIVLVGGNDYLRRVPDEAVFENVSKIVEDIHKRGAIVLLVGIRGGVLVDQYASRFKDVSRQYKTAYIEDALKGLLGRDEFMADSVHPNDQGYARLAGRVAPVLKDLLQ